LGLVLASAVTASSSAWALDLDSAFSELEQAYPGADGGITMTGADVRVILERVVPDLEKYMQDIVNHIDSLDVKRGAGRMLVNVAFETPFALKIADRDKAKRGQIHAVKISRKAHFEISMRRQIIRIDRIKGVSIKIKLPVVPEGVWPRTLVLDADTEDLRISAHALAGSLRVVAKANVRERKFTGVDWASTIARNWALILGALIFIPH
jgi:hypothetical protein